jgi:hypothetical protein
MGELAAALRALLPDLLTAPALPAPPPPPAPTSSLLPSDAPGPPRQQGQSRRRAVALTVLVAGLALVGSVVGGLAIGGSTEVGPAANGISTGPYALGGGAPSGSPGATPLGGVSATLVSASRLPAATPKSGATTATAPVSVAVVAPTDTTITSTASAPAPTAVPITWQCTTTTWNDSGTQRPVKSCVGTDGTTLYVSGEVSNAPANDNEIQLRLFLGSGTDTYRSYTYTKCSGTNCQLTETVTGAVAGTYHSMTASLNGSNLRFTSGSSPDLTYP